jgi:hypothetical protein
MEFFKSTTGRLMALSVAVALVLGSISAMMSPGAESAFVLCASLFVPIVLNMIGLPRALETDWYHAVIAVATLPLLFFLWAVGVGVIREHHRELAYLFFAVGLFPLGVAVRPTRGAAAHSVPIAQH